MAAPKVVIGSEKGAIKTPVLSVSERVSTAWGTLWWVGVLLFAAGVVDVGLAFYPPNFGDPTWRFEVAASVANGLPLPIVGLLGATMAAVAGRKRWRGQVVLFFNGLFTVFLVVMLITFLLVMSPSFKVAAPQVLIGLYKAAFRTILFYGVFAGATVSSMVVVARWLRSILGDV